MRTSLIEIQHLENWLLSRGEPTERLLTEVKVQLDTDLKQKAQWQDKTYQIIKAYGRQQLREEVTAIEQKMLSAPKYRSFRERILSIFKK